MRIVVDGYNLLKALPECRSLEALDLQRAREHLIAQLGRYRWLRGHQVTVVFDGRLDGYLIPRQTNSRGVQVIYSQRGEEADDVICRVAPQVAHQGVVVTSDRALAYHIQQLGAEVISSGEFAKRLHAALLDKARDDMAGDQEEPSSPSRHPSQKGPARRRSRAERRRERKLRNL